MLNNIEIVEIINNQPMTNSLKIAEVFGKDHSKVLRDVRKLECSKDFLASNFGEAEYTNADGVNYPMYNITKDGFVFLVMGFTGAKAAQFKEAYINEFNRMEQQLREQSRNLILSNKDYLIKMLKNMECYLTWDDLVEISHKNNTRDICRFLTVKTLLQKGNISNTLNEIENMQELLKIY